MHPVLRKMLIGLGGLIGLLVILTPVLPGTVHVERSIVIARPAATVFTVLDSFVRFHEWSPWDDPDMTVEHSGPRSGVGARTSWKSEQFGDGSQEIVASTPYERIEVQLELGSMGQPKAYYQLTPGAEGTSVTWAFDQSYSSFDVMGRWFGLLLPGFIGGDYERGLARLKTLVETLPAADFAGLEVELVDVQPFAVVSVRSTTSTEPEAIGPAVEGAFTVAETAVMLAKLPRVASPHRVSFGHRWDESAKVFEFEAAIPVAVEAAEVTAPVAIRVHPATRAARVIHRGPDEGLWQVHERLSAWMAAQGYPMTWPVWEASVGTPEAPVTEVHYPLP